MLALIGACQAEGQYRIEAAADAPCSASQPCQAGLLCYQGSCRSPCLAGAVCLAGRVCRASLCLPCDADSDCDAWWTCDREHGRCRASCQDDAHCKSSGFCAPTRICLPDREDGNPCDHDGQCQSGVCWQERWICCDRECDGPCRSCLQSDTEQPDGRCGDVLAGLDPFDECSGEVACDGLGACFARQPGAGCSDAFECTSAFCAHGVCCLTQCDAPGQRCGVGGVCYWCGDRSLDPGEACDDGNLFAWDGCGGCAITELQLNALGDGDQYAPRLAMLADGWAVAAWVSNDGSSTSTGYLRAFPAAPLSGWEATFGCNLGSSPWPVAIAALDDRRAVLSWLGAPAAGQESPLHGLVIARDGLSLGPVMSTDQTLQRHVHALDVAAGDGERFVVAWSALPFGAEYSGVFAQRFEADGQSLGPAQRLDAGSDTFNTAPTVAMLGEGFVVAWMRFSQERPVSVLTRRFDGAGVPLGEERRLTPDDPYHHGLPDIAADAAGFIVVWQRMLAPGGTATCLGQGFAPDGSSLGPIQPISSGGTDYQYGPAVAADGAGGFAAAWLACEASLGGCDVVWRMLGPDLSPLNAEVRANTFHPLPALDPPAIALDAHGRVLVAWSSFGQDGDGYGVFAQRFTVAGTPLGAASW